MNHPFGTTVEFCDRLLPSGVRTYGASVVGPAGQYVDVFSTELSARHWAEDVLVAYFGWSTGGANALVQRTVTTKTTGRVSLPEHVFLVAFTVSGKDRETAERSLYDNLPDAASGHPTVTSWWMAEDDRLEGSDCDSAVFVTPGNQAKASILLEGWQLTTKNNVITRESRF